MPDWMLYIDRHLTLPNIPGSRREKILRELASQAEEIYLGAIAAGATRDEAVECVERQIGDWDRLAEEIRREEKPGVCVGIERRMAVLEDNAGKKGRGWTLLLGTLQDLRFSMRLLRKRPLLGGIAVLTLSLGIGAATAIFSTLDAVLLQALPFKKPGDLVFLWERARDQDMPVSYPDFLDWRAESREFEKLTAYRSVAMNLTGVVPPLQVSACLVTADFFPLLGVQPALGRDFLADEDRIDAKPVVLLSHRFWRNQFAADPDILGGALHLDQQSHTVIGILPPRFSFPPGSSQSIDLFVPFGLHSEPWAHNRTARPAIRVLGRLKEGSSLESAQADLSDIAVRLERQYPESNTGVRAGIQPFHETMVQNVRPALRMLAAACALLLLVASANLANLLLVGAGARQREIALRSALGARPARIVRQLLIECTFLCLLGGLAGLFVAGTLIRVFSTGIATSLPLADRIGMDVRVFAFTLALSILVGVVVGLKPALVVARTDLHETLKEGRQTASVFGRRSFQSILVVGEVALALVLLVGAGLLVRSLNKLMDAELGFDPREVFTARISLPEAKYESDAQKITFFRLLLERAQHLPGAQSAALTMYVPLRMNWWENSYYVEGTPPPPLGQEPTLDFSVASPDFHRTMGIPIVNGRAFTSRDTADSVRVAIVDRRFADRYWPGRDPIGRRFKLGKHDSDEPWWSIVGIAGTVDSRGAGQPSPEKIYVPFEQFPGRTMFLAVKSGFDPDQMTAAVRALVQELDPEQPVSAIATVERYLWLATSSQRLYALLMATFAALSLLLSVSGIYGVVSYSIRQRTHEIGVRVAMGAKRSQLLGMVFRQSMTLVILGIGIGAAGALGLTHLLSGMLFGIEPADPATFAAVSILMVSVAALACLLPARRAALIDPILALRNE